MLKRGNCSIGDMIIRMCSKKDMLLRDMLKKDVILATGQLHHKLDRVVWKTDCNFQANFHRACSIGHVSCTLLKFEPGYAVQGWWDTFNFSCYYRKAVSALYVVFTGAALIELAKVIGLSTCEQAWEIF